MFDLSALRSPEAVTPHVVGLPPPILVEAHAYRALASSSVYARGVPKALEGFVTRLTEKRDSV